MRILESFLTAHRQAQPLWNNLQRRTLHDSGMNCSEYLLSVVSKPLFGNKRDRVICNEQWFF